MFHLDKTNASGVSNQEASHFSAQFGNTNTEVSQRLKPESAQGGQGTNYLQTDQEDSQDGATISNGKPSVVFMFSGYESEPHRCAKPLYENFDFFHERVEECLWHLTQIDGHLAGETERFFGECQTEEGRPVSQVQLFVFEYALASTLIHWGIKPDALIGESLGECVAACISGLLDIDDALSMVCSRQRLMESAQSGAMFAVPESKEQVNEWLDEWNEEHTEMEQKLSLAYVNAPNECVVSGGSDPLTHWLEQHAKEAIRGQYVSQRYAFHSDLMSEACKTLASYIEGLPSHPIKTPFVSTVTGRWAQQSEVESTGYWANQIRQTVQLEEGLRCVSEELGNCMLVEIGLGESMSKLVEQQGNDDLCAFPLLPELLAEDIALPQNFACQCVLASVKTLNQYGVNIRWERVPA